MTNEIAKNGLIFFPEFCKVKIKFEVFGVQKKNNYFQGAIKFKVGGCYLKNENIQGKNRGNVGYLKVSFWHKKFSFSHNHPPPSHS